MCNIIIGRNQKSPTKNIVFTPTMDGGVRGSFRIPSYLLPSLLRKVLGINHAISSWQWKFRRSIAKRPKGRERERDSFLSFTILMEEILRINHAISLRSWGPYEKITKCSICMDAPNFECTKVLHDSNMVHFHSSVDIYNQLIDPKSMLESAS